VNDWLDLNLRTKWGWNLAMFIKFEGDFLFVIANGRVVHELIKLFHIYGLLPLVNKDISIFDFCLEHFHGLSHIGVHELSLVLYVVQITSE
jgi:hypothetical protein